MKKMVAIALSALCLCTTLGTPSYAARENIDQFSKKIIDDNRLEVMRTYIDHSSETTSITIPDGYVNYIKPATGEYFIVTPDQNIVGAEGPAKIDSVAKKFSFEIRIHLDSAPFGISSDTLSVYSYGKLYDEYGNNISGHYGSTYSVGLHQSLLKQLSVLFPINGGQTSTFGSGWRTDKRVTVSVDNAGSWDRYNATLKGSGTVYND